MAIVLLNKHLNMPLNIRIRMTEGSIVNDIDKKILKMLKKLDGPVSKTGLAKHIKLSPATTSKYVDVLAAKGLVSIAVYGNIHLVSAAEVKSDGQSL